MSSATTAVKPMDADAFLAWGEARAGRWELRDGAAVAMSPERSAHALTKYAAQRALTKAISAGRKPCRVYPDGMAVRVSESVVYEPDGIIVCGPKVPRDALSIANPVVVLEVLSPSTASIDHGRKLSDYFSLASVAHYLILDPDRRVVIHHARGEGDALVTRVLAQGLLTLDPPGIAVAVEDMFAED